MTGKFIKNCGAPKHKAFVRAGKTWSAKHRKYLFPDELGAVVTKAPKGWQKLFGAPEAPRGLKVVSITYWPEDVDRKGVK